MNLEIKVETKIKDLVIDYIQVNLKDGRSVAISWDESNRTNDENGLSADYEDLSFNDEYDEVSLKDLIGMEVDTVGLYSEEMESTGKKYEAGQFNMEILSMVFDDKGEVLKIENVPYRNVDWTY